MADIADGEAFYSLLEKVVADTKRGDIIILMGDWNAQVGGDNANLENVMVKHGFGAMNVNGERFTELYCKNDLVVGVTIFPHKRVHKETWVSSDQRTEYQIDHIVISRKWRGSLIDVRNI